MASMIEASRAEAGCLEYCYAEDVLDRGLFILRNGGLIEKLSMTISNPHT